MCRETVFSKSSFRAISAESSFETLTLDNGIRLVHQYIESPVAYCALMINAGSRDEFKNAAGAAHLTEHLIFKETQKRKAYHILSRMENVGGDLNAYTSKEDTCIHAVFLSDYYARALELFSDLVFNHKITEKTLKIEKKVVLDEIESYKDNPSELIFDDFEEMLFPGHPLGRNTLGTKQSVDRISKDHLERFIACNYHPEQMVLSSSGKISMERLLMLVEKYFGQISVPQGNRKERTMPSDYYPFARQIRKRNHQSHCIIGTTCDSSDRKFRIRMHMLANLLGGPGMNTRLNMSLRERNGWVYHVEASYTPYSDVGVFNIYFGTDAGNLEKCMRQTERELTRLKECPLTNMQLKRLQQQMIGQLAIASDNYDSKVLSAAKNVLLFDKVQTLFDTFVEITDVKADELCEAANQAFSNLSSLTYL